MSEYEILDLANRVEDQVTVGLQWWGGVSFGLLALGHFAAKKLNISLVVLIVFLYASFSVMSLSRLTINSQEYAGYIRDLIVLQESGAPLSQAAVELVESEVSNTWYERLTFYSALLGTFFGSIGYLVYTSLRERRSRKGHAGAA